MAPTSRSARQLSAFSLIELLVVISIIAVLAAMLLPAISLVRTQAKAMACASSLRQIGMCTATYVQENAGLLPLALDKDGYHWYQLLATYAEVSDKDNLSFTDAAFNRRNIMVGCTEYRRDPARPWRIGYGYTHRPLMPGLQTTLMYSVADAASGKFRNVDASSVTKQSLRMLAACSDEWTLGPSTSGPWWSYGGTWGPHKKLRNVLAYDLHIERMHSSELIKRIYDPASTL